MKPTLSSPNSMVQQTGVIKRLPNRKRQCTLCTLLAHKESSSSDCETSLSRQPPPVTRVCHLYDYAAQTVPYQQGSEWQKALVKKVQRGAGSLAGGLIILQHAPVYTFGAGSLDQHAKFDLSNPPLPVFRTERGGEITFHGPGQLVMYPVLDLRLWQMDLHWYMRSLEQVVINALDAVSGLQGERIPGLTGVWVDGSKLAAIGIRASRWVTYHGLALNVTTDLTPFSAITPCGISDRPVGSVRSMLERLAEQPGGSCWAGAAAQDDAQMLAEYRVALLDAFCEVFNVELCPPPCQTP